jgi:D-alanyl-lipoteichoic acid acyltransferase DltB (MBOAT superfamily)
VSDWFKFYVFNPFLKTLLETYTRPGAAPYLGAAGYFLAFFLMGLWHGRTPALIAYGLALGAGVSLNKLFQVWSAQRLGRRGYAALAARAVYQLFAQALALSYFVLALGFLWMRTPDVAQVGIAGVCGAVLLTVAACAMLALGTRLPVTARAAPSPSLSRVIATGQAIGSATYLWLAQGAVPELLYQRL